MKGDKIKYQSGYKYQLAEDYTVQVGICPKFEVGNPFLILRTNGELVIKRGYAWDGASGWTFDTKSVMRASLVHDALYQLMREELIDLRNKEIADDLLRDIMVEDGAFKIRGWYWHIGVDKFGLVSATYKGERKIEIAP
jgi:hypothetical protein